MDRAAHPLLHLLRWERNRLSEPCSIRRPILIRLLCPLNLWPNPAVLDAVRTRLAKVSMVSPNNGMAESVS